MIKLYKKTHEVKLNEQQLNELLDGDIDKLKLNQLVTERPTGSTNTVFSVKVTIQECPTQAHYRNREWMVENYCNQYRSCAEIGEQFGVSAVAIHQWLAKHSITPRSRGFKKEYLKAGKVFLERHGENLDSR